MKRISKKLTALVLALAMVLSLTVVASATGLTATAAVAGATELKSATVELAAVSGAVTQAALEALDGLDITLSYNGSSWAYSASATGYDVTDAANVTADGDATTEKSFALKDSGGTNTLATVKFKAQEDTTNSTNFTGTITLSVTSGSPGGNANSVPQTGTSRGAGVNEGGLPASVYDVVLPLDSTTIFNMILDPHSLMADTAYKKLGGEDKVDFSDVSGRLFFQNDAGDTSANPVKKATYSGTSNALTVVNRSWVDVEATLNLQVTKPTESDTQKTFSFTDENLQVGGADVDGAGMYLAMISTPTAGVDAQRLTVTAGGTLATEISDIETDITDEDLATGVLTVTYDGTTNHAYTALTDAALTVVSGYTATMTAVAKGGDGEITVKKGTDVVGTVTFTSSGNESADGTLTLTFAETTPPAEPLNITVGGALAAQVQDVTTTVTDTDLLGKTISLSFVTGGSTSTYAYSALVADAFATGYTATMSAVSAGGNGTITVSDGTNNIGTVTFKSKGTENADGALTFTFAASSAASAPVTQAVGADGKAQIKTTIAARQSLYKKDWDGSAKKYIYTLQNASEPNSSFNQIDFKLTGKINNNDDWDNIAVYETTDTGAIAIALTWTIGEVTPPAEPKDPSVRVTTPVTTVGNTVVMSYDLGAGTLEMDEVESFSYTTATNTLGLFTTSSAQLTIDTDNKTISVIAVNPVFNGSDWAVNFKNSAGETKSVPVNIKVAG